MPFTSEPEKSCHVHHSAFGIQYPDLKPPSTPSPPAVEDKTEVKTETVAIESPAAVNSAPVAEASTESPPATPRPLSPYPNVSYISETSLPYEQMQIMPCSSFYICNSM